MQAIKNRRGSFPQGQAIAVLGRQAGDGGDGGDGQLLALKGAAGSGELPGVGD